MSYPRSRNQRQMKLGPAPFASFDHSEDLSSPESKGYEPMPEIYEDGRTSYYREPSVSDSSAQTPTTPRIDVEQASSPSQEDSYDSTPEREIFGMDADGNITSEFLEGIDEMLRAADVAKSDQVSWDVADQHSTLDNTFRRKGSCGFGGKRNIRDLSCFPGQRDTRLSSISSNVSGTSGMSQLSAFSRRSPSPHRMQLETSFCGPKTNPHQLQKDNEEDQFVSRRTSLGIQGHRMESGSTTPVSNAVSPGFSRRLMVNYVTEPRSRPTSPLGFSPPSSPIPPFSRNQGTRCSLRSDNGDAIQQRWLASPRCERRASSPHRTLVETSFCGAKLMQVPDDSDVAPRGPSPSLSSMSVNTLNTLPIKYVTEPRSRPASPPRNYLSTASDSRRGSYSSLHCPSPSRMKVETSFCGAKQVARAQESQDRIELAPKGDFQVAEPELVEAFNLARPIQFFTEPGSRSISPNLNVVVHSSAEPHRRIRTRDRSPSPLIETSFVGKKQMTRQETELAHRIAAKLLEQEVNPVIPDNSVNPTTPASPKRPVKYTNEPRSRPISPSVSFLSRGRPEGRMRSPSPMRMQVETSFCGKQQSAQRQKSQEPVPSSNQSVPDQQIVNLTPVKYVTEPRSRPVSPLLPFDQQLAHETVRSSSPNPALLETSFVGSKQNPNRDPSIDIARGSPHPVPVQEVVNSTPVKYSTEPRSRPVSPIFKPDPTTSMLDVGHETKRTRSPSPNRMLMETSFLGSKQNQKRDDSIDIIKSSPHPVPGQEVANPSPVKYSTEPRSRPVSPIFKPDALDVEQKVKRTRSPSPNRMLMETSFVGAKQERNREPSTEIFKDSPHPIPTRVVNVTPVKYSTEPRSRPDSPIFKPDTEAYALDTEHRVIHRSPSPNRMLMETSFVGSKQKQNRDPSIDVVRGSPYPVPDQEVVNASPVKYSTEPRSQPVSRPVSPIFRPDMVGSISDLVREIERTRSPSPSRMLMETSFVGSKQNVNREPSIDIVKGSRHRVREPQVVSASPVKYSTEPRSRPASPSSFLSGALTDRRECRSPSPNRMLVETSFCGSKKLVRDESKDDTVHPTVHSIPDQEIAHAAPVKYVTEPRSRPVSPTTSIPDLGRSSSTKNRTAPPPPPRRKTSIASSTSSRNSPTVPNVASEFIADWNRQFPETSIASASSEALNLQLSHSGSGMINSPSKLTLSGRSKPVACPKPPANFAESAQNSPTAPSPALIRRAEAMRDSPTTPSQPSSPVPTRRISFSSVFRRGSVSSITEEKTTTPTALEATDAASKESKGRSVLSALFGKKTKKREDIDDDGVNLSPVETSTNSSSKNRNKSALKLPIPSRESSPGRSFESNEDADEDAEGFSHQTLGGEFGKLDTNLSDSDKETEDRLSEKTQKILEDKENEVKAELKEEASLFQHQDSLEDELPYVPTTLPIERPVAAVITPIRMRISQVKTTPTVRPRCSTFIGPSSIKDYSQIVRTDSVEAAEAKIKVQLPRRPDEVESPPEGNIRPIIRRVPIKASLSSGNWEAFAGAALHRRNIRRLDTLPEEPSFSATSPPPNPVATTSGGNSWVDVETLPEPIKEPKTIKIVSSKQIKSTRVPEPSCVPLHDEPEEICRVKENRKDSVCSETALLREVDEQEPDEDRSPPTEDNSDASVSIIDDRISQSSSLAELEAALEHGDAAGLVRPNQLDVAPFGMDLDVHSNRSSIVATIDAASPEDDPTPTK